MHATLTFDSSLSRTLMLLPSNTSGGAAAARRRGPQADAADDEEEEDVPLLPTFQRRTRTKKGGSTEMTVSLMGRTVKTEPSLRQLAAVSSTLAADATVCRLASAARNTPLDSWGALIVDRDQSAAAPSSTTATAETVGEGTERGASLSAFSVNLRGPPPRITRLRRQTPQQILQSLVTHCAPPIPERGMDLQLAIESAPHYVSPPRRGERFADVRPSSSGGVSIFREKLFSQLTAALPEALLREGLQSDQCTAPQYLGEVPDRVAQPSNILIPSCNRYPEAVRGPSGVASVVRETRSWRTPSPTAHVRRLQQQLALEAPPRTHEDLQAKFALRPQSVDLLSGRAVHDPPRVNRTRPPTACTLQSRSHLHRLREHLQVQSTVSSDSLTRVNSGNLVAVPSIGSGTFDQGALSFRNSVVRANPFAPGRRKRSSRAASLLPRSS